MVNCKNCTKRASFGNKDSTIKEYCGDHAPPDYIIIGAKRCKICFKHASYGEINTNNREYCKKHAPIGYINVNAKKCKFCDKTAQYVEKDSKLREYCKDHAPIGYKRKDSKCKECDTRATYGKEGSSKIEYCKSHAPTDYVSITHKLCKMCTTRACFGPKNSKILEFCQKHAPADYINITSKQCKMCDIPAQYGIKGSRVKEYCIDHAPIEYVLITHKCLLCDKSPSYKEHNNTVAKYCKNHAPEGYVTNKIKCLLCNTTASYGQKDKLQEYCKLHAPHNYINVVSPQCVLCDKYPRYAIPSINNRLRLGKPTHCLSHKQSGMIQIKNCIIKDCNRSALYGTTKPIHCEEHKLDEDIDMIERECKNCQRIERVNIDGICWDYCVATTNYNKLYKKGILVKQQKIMLLLQREIKADLYCTDKVIDSSCSLRRPDFVYHCGSHIVIIEVDEKAGNCSSYHSESSEKEKVRMFEISNCFEGCPLIFIRYNPDDFHIDGKLIKIFDKELMLIKWIDKALAYNSFPPNNKIFPTVMTVYLYYNEYDQTINTFKELSQEYLTKGLMPCH